MIGQSQCSVMQIGPLPNLPGVLIAALLLTLDNEQVACRNSPSTTERKLPAGVYDIHTLSYKK